MATHISLLRGINVSGQKKVDMKKLKQLYESLGFKEVQTYIQSGNVIFEHAATKIPELLIKIQNKIMQYFGFEVFVVIRTKHEFQKLIQNNPFAGKDESRIYVTFLSEKPKDVLMEEIEKVKGKEEEFFLSGKEIYFFCPHGYGRTKLSNNFFERKLKVAATTRNWRTVSTLLSLAQK